MRVFLGGTCNKSDWRQRLIPKLQIDFFDPVVDDWTPDCMEEELRQRKSCDYVLYVLTPRMTGVYAVAEVVDDSNKQPGKTLLCVLLSDGTATFSEGQMKSLNQVKAMVAQNGAIVCETLEDIATVLSPPDCPDDN